MNDTHGANGKPWIGFDLDGTLAKYDGWKGIDHIGEPIAPIVKRMKELHEYGSVVKIMTARIAPRDEFGGEEYIEVPATEKCEGYRVYASTFIKRWCLANVGFVPEIVHEKDHLMIALFDDRVIQVEPNSGVVLGNDFTKTTR